jgi:hypothetical protein
MAQQGGHTIAGEDGYGDDEVGARRRRRHKRRSSSSASASQSDGNAESSTAPSVDWSSSDDAGDDDEDDEIGASVARRRPGKVMPVWLKFNATQSLLAGDPKLIQATATVMRRMGYHEHAAIHLRALAALPR